MNDLRRSAWNQGRVVGERIAFSAGEVQAIARSLAAIGAHHDLCLFAVGIDSMLRCSDLLRLRVEDVVEDDGRIRWRQKKTQQNVYPVLTTTTQRAVKDWIESSGKQSNHFLFTRDKPVSAKPITPGYYRTLVKQWAELIGLAPERYSTHSLRRTKASHLYGQGYSDIAHIARLLGHQSTDATIRYLGIQQAEAETQALLGDIFTADLNEQSTGHPLLREFLKPEFLDQFSDAIWQRLDTKLSDFIDENRKEGR
ncbi:MAG: tyrosine-type recombinase/integrase [Pseudomonadota bacterium]